MKHKVKRVLSIVMALTWGCSLTVPTIAKEADADEPEAEVVTEVIEVYAEEIDGEYGIALVDETDFSDWSVLTAQGGTKWWRRE